MKMVKGTLAAAVVIGCGSWTPLEAAPLGMAPCPLQAAPTIIVLPSTLAIALPELIADPDNTGSECTLFRLIGIHVPAANQVDLKILDPDGTELSDRFTVFNNGPNLDICYASSFSTADGRMECPVVAGVAETVKTEDAKDGVQTTFAFNDAAGKPSFSITVTSEGPEPAPGPGVFSDTIEIVSVPEGSPVILIAMGFAALLILRPGARRLAARNV